MHVLYLVYSFLHLNNVSSDMLYIFIRLLLSHLSNSFGPASDLNMKCTRLCMMSTSRMRTTQIASTNMMGQRNIVSSNNCQDIAGGRDKATFSDANNHSHSRVQSKYTTFLNNLQNGNTCQVELEMNLLSAVSNLIQLHYTLLCGQSLHLNNHVTFIMVDFYALLY